MRKILMTALATTLLFSMPVHAGDALTPAQKEEVKAVIKQYLTEESPEVIRKAVQVLQQRDQTEQLQSTLDLVEKNKSKIYDDADTPVLGNPKGDVSIVEFFDYHCGYCKMAHPAIVDALEKDKNLRFVAKEYPILGDESLLAARAALASVKQGKYEKFHDALMTNRGAMNDASIMELAKKSGLNVEKLQKDMQDNHISVIIDANRALAQTIGVRGTPLFIIGDEIRPGALNADDIKTAVENARKKLKK